MTYQSVHPIVIEIYCELQLHIQQFLHTWNFAVTNDKHLQQFSTEKWLDMCNEIYLPYSDNHHPLLLH